MIDTLVICNQSSGNAEAAENLESLLDQTTTHIEYLTQDTDLNVLVKNAAESGCIRVVAAGGDGTVNSVVNALMQLPRSGRPRMAILPLGTANDFAMTLEMPDDIQAATALISNSDAYLPIDVAEVRGRDYVRYFANIAAGGNSVRVSEEMTSDLKERWGAYCYLRGAMNVLGDLDSYRVTAKCDDEQFTDLHVWAVLVANGKTNAGRITVAPHARPNDGLLDVVIIQDGTVVDIMEIVSEAIFGNYLECEQVIFRQCKSLLLNATPAMRFTMDGEVVDEEPVYFSVVPQAIEMLVGPGLAQLAQSVAGEAIIPKSSGLPLQG